MVIIKLYWMIVNEQHAIYPCRVGGLANHDIFFDL